MGHFLWRFQEAPRLPLHASWIRTPKVYIHTPKYTPKYTPKVYIYVPTHNFLGGSDGKASAYSAGDPDSNPWGGKIPWRRKWPSTPVFLPGECHGWRSLVDNPWGCKESDTTESFTFFPFDPPEAPCHLLPHPIRLGYHRTLR